MGLFENGSGYPQTRFQMGVAIMVRFAILLRPVDLEVDWVS